MLCVFTHNNYAERYVELFTVTPCSEEEEDEMNVPLTLSVFRDKGS